MREFNVEDKVKCIDARDSINRELKNGKIYIVSHVDTNGFVKLKGGSSYYYDPSRFKKIEYTYEDLKKSAIGTKITFEDGNVFVKDGENYFENKHRCRDISNLYNLKDNYNDSGKIIKIEEPTYTTVYEAKKEILDEAEKRYLKQVIRPYNKVISLQKYAPSNIKLAIIKITVSKIGGGIWTIDLPPFEKNTMYKNMEDNKEYTLEELDL